MTGALLLMVLGAAHARPVALTADDGVALHGESVGSGTVGVLLVHDSGQSSEAWGPLAEKLASKGMRVLAVDLRGHGESTPDPELTEDDHVAMVKDVAARAKWLARQGSQEVLAVGAGLGANLAITAAAFGDGIDGVAMITPTLTSRGVKVSAALRSYGNRPLLVAGDENDTVLARAATLIQRDNRGPTEIALHARAGSGTRMLTTAPQFEGQLLGWLSGSWKVEAVERDRNAQASEVGDIETSGTKLGDRQP